MTVVDIDLPTLLAANGAIVTISGVAFILATVLGRNDAIGRAWSIAFLAGIVTTACYAIWGYLGEDWWAAAIGNGAIVLAIGMMWSGCRLCNGRTSLSAVSLALSAVTTLAVLVDGPTGGEWAGAVTMFSCVSIFGALAGAETLRGAMRRNQHARVLTVVFWIVAVFYLARTVVFIAAGEDSDLFDDWFGTVITTIVTILLVIVASISMSVIQGERIGSKYRKHSAESPARDGILPMSEFTACAEDWILRAERQQVPLALVLLEVENLEDINIAYGRDRGDEVIREVGRVTSFSVPPATLIGQFDSHRFAVLTTASGDREAAAIAERLHDALVETALPQADFIRALASYGVANTDTSGYVFAPLLAAANHALAQATLSGAGSVSAAPSSTGTAA
ncbi:GGDEF domain-containing protein [Marisediminicola senii]|uniref:GGDEF domain-containing protein n=1 Tax=Marisediminicola senii TaxID=2711233 RepID=UPI0013EAB2BC|nr:diguanylate cyclase [Marisediminicola senii]